MKWALVLSGGGGNGIAHVGILKQLEKLELIPDLIVGTSMGAVVGGVYASGKSADWLEDHILNEFEIKDMISSYSFKMGQGPVARALQAGTALRVLTASLGVEPGSKILEHLRDITNDIPVSSCKIPFCCNSVNLLDGKETIFDSHQNLAEAIRCSISYMPFFEPYEMGEGLYVDGCVADNLAVHIAREKGYKKILSVNVSPLREIKKDQLKNSFETVFRAMSVSMQDKPEEHKATVELLAYEGAYNFDFSHAEKLIELGERVVRENESKILKKFKPWYKRINLDKTKNNNN